MMSAWQGGFFFSFFFPQHLSHKKEDCNSSMVIPGVQRRTERGFSCTGVPSFDFHMGKSACRHKTKIDCQTSINTTKNAGSETWKRQYHVFRCKAHNIKLHQIYMTGRNIGRMSIDHKSRGERKRTGGRTGACALDLTL